MKLLAILFATSLISLNALAAKDATVDFKPVGGGEESIEGLPSPAAADVKIDGRDALKYAFYGAGVRTKFIFDVYVAQFFVADGAVEQFKAASDKIAAVNDVGAVALKLHFKRDLSAPEVSDSLKKALRDNKVDDNDPAIQDLMNVLSSAGDFKGEQDVVIVAEKQAGSSQNLYVVLPNGAAKLIQGGADFASKIMQIWLGKKPADGDLKDSILAQCKKRDCQNN